MYLLELGRLDVVANRTKKFSPHYAKIRTRKILLQHHYLPLINAHLQ
ncbi:MAG: hypothetical protein KAI83_03840 [Thiomargarita sp.]|nr:hypothetical protein [Thiomargarita sp.]